MKTIVYVIVIVLVVAAIYWYAIRPHLIAGK